MHSILHSPWSGAIGLWIVSALVGGMPAPDQNSGKGYRWLYGSFHLLAANLDKVASSVNPPIK